MIYEHLVRVRDNHNVVIKFLNQLNYNIINIENQLLNNIVKIELNKEDFKDLYNNIRLAPFRNRKLKILLGLRPVYVVNNIAEFYYKTGNITFIFYRKHPIKSMIINDALNKYKLEQKLLNM